MRLRDAVRMTRDEKLGLFGDGPWVDEPDRCEWRAFGLPCLVLRSRGFGTLCGYVAVPRSHPLYGRSTLTVVDELEVHGGITYANRCAGAICHDPEPGEPGDVWWLGFNASHLGDCIPSADGDLRAHLPEEFQRVLYGDDDPDGPVYRDLAYMRGECVRLAAQLARYGDAP